MKDYTCLYKYPKHIVLGISFLLLFGSITQAQTTLNIKDFAVFGNATPSATDPTRYGVEMSKNIDILGGGAVGTNSLLQMQTQVSITGNIYASTATAGNNNTIKGTTSIYNKSAVSNAVLKFGTASTFSAPGNIIVNGSSSIGNTNSSVAGYVQHPKGTAYAGPTPLGGNLVVESVTLPAMPTMPAITSFTAGTTDITASRTITPSKYGTIALTGNQTLVFSGVGDYYFKSIANLNINNFTFDFLKSTTGNIRLFIQDTAALANISVNIINGGSSGQIYTEVHGTGNTGNGFNALSMNIIGTNARWAGTVWAPYGSIQIGQPNSGSSNVVNGCLWSGTKVKIGFNTTITYVPQGKTLDALPYYPPPATGKTNSLIGTELTQLYYNAGDIGNDSIIYRVFSDKVYIEVIALQGKYAATLSFLQSNGLTDIISNGPNSLIITGKFPIANLLLLNSRTDLIDYVRPLFWPIRNSGIVQSQGDKAMQSNTVRNGYSLSGTGVKVGVISDSYNTIPGNYASIDISNGDLPPAGVQVVREYDLGQSIDEGRAMLQIVHDVAPDAPLAFRTGYLTAGDFAQGIGELRAAGCKVIVDDITYITEPYFKDGVIAQAVDQAVANNTSYYSAAGNFGKKSYEAMFTGTTVPAALSQITTPVHNFGGSALQTLNLLTPGNYTIVLQWNDGIYSSGSSATGTTTDLDIYLVDNTGTTLFGFNRNNIGNDPLEILPFTVSGGATTAKLLITKAQGPDVPFKYIVFRGNLTIDGYPGASTLVGQANSAGATAVGAVLYSNTPPFGVNPPTIASFSSVGGMPVNGVLRNKPEIVAPNGNNTTVDFNSFELEGDRFPNFYGTSAAAPHAAASAALIIEGKHKFLGRTIASVTPGEIKDLLKSTANHMGVALPGYSVATGYGFVQPFAAMQTFASPKPEIGSLLTTPELTIPPAANYSLAIKGNYFVGTTRVLFNSRALGSDSVHVTTDSTLTATLPSFSSGDPTIQLYTPPISTSGLDGGYSAITTLYAPAKKHVVVKADDKVKKYGEKLPAFTATITIDGVTATASQISTLKLTDLKYSTPATSSSNVASYYIQPVNPILENDPLLLSYTYEFINGVLTIEKLPLEITARDTVLTYGNQIHGIKYNYDFGSSPAIQNPDSLLNAINASNTAAILDSLYGIINGAGTASKTLVNSDLENLGILISNGTGTASRTLVNSGSGATETSYLAEVDTTTVLYYVTDPLATPTITNGAGTASKTLVNTGPLVNGTASVTVTSGAGTASKTLVNGDPGLLNSSTTGSTTKSNVAVIVSYADVSNTSATSYPILTKPANMVTGITAGSHIIVPAAYLSGNHIITYGTGKLTINKAPYTVAANTVYTDNGVLPPFTYTFGRFQYQDASKIKVDGVVNSTLLCTEYPPCTTFSGLPGKYIIRPGGLTLTDISPYKTVFNYFINYVDGYLYINPYGTNAKKINLQLKCVEPIKNDPQGYTYVAHFSYENKNATPIYIPIGTNNKISGNQPYSVVQPEVFEPGIHYVDIKFMGQKITWDLKSNDGATSKKSLSEVSANTSSPKCSSLSQTITTATDIEAIPEGIQDNQAKLYPNPATNRLWIANKGLGLGKTIAVSNAEGRTVHVPITQRTAQWLVLNVAGLHQGVYFIQLTNNDGTVKTLSFVKL